MNSTPTPAPTYTSSMPHPDAYHNAHQQPPNMNTYQTGQPMQWQQPQPQQPPQAHATAEKTYISPTTTTEVHHQQYHNSQFQTAVPIPSLSRTCAPVDCPGCHCRAMTTTALHAGNTTHAWGLGLCCLTGVLCCVPYLMDSMKDVDHSCGKCGKRLATWHKSGRVDVHAYA